MTDTFVMIGASLAGGNAAITLREEGFEGRIVLIGAEEHFPYERPPLSTTRGRRARSSPVPSRAPSVTDHDDQSRATPPPLGRRRRSTVPSMLSMSMRPPATSPSATLTWPCSATVSCRPQVMRSSARLSDLSTQLARHAA